MLEVLDHKQAESNLSAAMVEHKISIKSRFVPQSLSRNSTETRPTLNWKITVEVNGRAILETDYSAGIGHIPGYRFNMRERVGVRDFIREICETGRYPSGYGFAIGRGDSGVKRWSGILPVDEVTAFSCLLMDSDVLDYSNFQEWAENMGFDSDSRKAESMYRDCLNIALTLRSALGEKSCMKMRECAQQM